MSRYQSTVIWLGLVLIALNIVIHIADLKTVLFGGSAPAPAKAQAPAQGAKTPPNVLAPGPLTTNPNQAPTVV